MSHEDKHHPEGVAALLFHKVYLRFGLYDKIISDQGPQFPSSFAQELGKLLQYDLSLSTAYHSQSDGETKWVNQEVEMYLWIFCGNNPGSWADNISHAEFAHNHCPHSVMNQSPFYLMMGYEPHALPSVISDTSIPAVETHLKTLSAARNEALAAHELARQVMAACTRCSFSPFKLGDKVWLEYQLCLPKTWKIHPVLHPSFLSPYHKNTVHSPNFPSPPPDLINGEEEYKVEKILHHCGTPTKCSFLIRWKGYVAEEDSWVCERNLNHTKSALTTYKRLHPAIFPS